MYIDSVLYTYLILYVFSHSSNMEQPVHMPRMLRKFGIGAVLDVSTDNRLVLGKRALYGLSGAGYVLLIDGMYFHEVPTPTDSFRPTHGIIVSKCTKTCYTIHMLCSTEHLAVAYSVSLIRGGKDACFTHRCSTRVDGSLEYTLDDKGVYYARCLSNNKIDLVCNFFYSTSVYTVVCEDALRMACMRNGVSACVSDTCNMAYTIKSVRCLNVPIATSLTADGHVLFVVVGVKAEKMCQTCMTAVCCEFAYLIFAFDIAARVPHVKWADILWIKSNYSSEVPDPRVYIRMQYIASGHLIYTNSLFMSVVVFDAETGRHTSVLNPRDSCMREPPQEYSTFWHVMFFSRILARHDKTYAGWQVVGVSHMHLYVCTPFHTRLKLGSVGGGAEYIAVPLDLLDDVFQCTTVCQSGSYVHAFVGLFQSRFGVVYVIAHDNPEDYKVDIFIDAVSAAASFNECDIMRVRRLSAADSVRTL